MGQTCCGHNVTAETTANMEEDYSNELKAFEKCRDRRNEKKKMIELHRQFTVHKDTEEEDK